MGQIIGIHTQSGPLLGYTAVPTQADRSGGILLLHDIWGLDDNTKQIADKLAAQGYTVLAPNLFSNTTMEKRLRPELQSVLFSSSRRERSMAQMQIQQLSKPLYGPEMSSQILVRAHASFEYLLNNPRLNRMVTLIGFGIGGTHGISLAIRDPRLTAVIVFYARISYVAWELRHIQCPVLGFSGAGDQLGYSSLQRMQQQMPAAGVNFEGTVYESAGEYFMNSSLPVAYDENSALDAWARSMSFMRKTMR